VWPVGGATLAGVEGGVKFPILAGRKLPHVYSSLASRFVGGEGPPEACAALFPQAVALPPEVDDVRVVQEAVQDSRGDDDVSHRSGQERDEALGSLHAKLAAGSKIWEGDTEPDAVIRLGQPLLVLVEAKRYSPLGTSTRYDSARDQVIRNLDVAFATANRAGIERAAVVVVGPSVPTDCCSWELVDRYQGNPVAIKEALLFRGPREDVSDELVALMARSLSRLTWDELAALSH